MPPAAKGSLKLPAWLAATLTVLDRTMQLAVIAAMAAMVILVAAQVLLRYAFATSIMAADELARLCFVWAVFLAIPLALAARRHVVVQLMTGWLPRRIRSMLARIVCALTAAVFAVAAWHSARVTLANWDETLPTIDLSAGTFFLAVAIGCGYAVVHAAVMAIFDVPTPHDGRSGTPEASP